MLELNGTQAALDGVTRTALDEIVLALEELVEPLKFNSIDGQLQRVFFNVVTESLKLVPLDYNSSSAVTTGGGSEEFETWEKLLTVLDLWRRGLGSPSLQPSTLNDVQGISGNEHDRNSDPKTLPDASPVDLVEDLRRNDATPWMQDIFNVSVALQAKSRAIDAKGVIEKFTIIEKAEAWVDAAGDSILSALQVIPSPETASEAEKPKVIKNSTGTPANHVVEIVANATSSVQPVVSSWFENIGRFTEGIVAGATSFFGEGKSSVNETSTESAEATSFISNQITTKVESKGVPS